MKRINYAILHPVKLGFAGGILAAICAFIVTFVGFLGWYRPGMLDLRLILDAFYGGFGYHPARFWFGAILGSILAFIDGFIASWIFAKIYNKLIK